MIRSNLSKLLGERRITMSECSRSTGIRRQTISDIYHGINVTISINNLDKLCRYFDCDICDLFTYTPPLSRAERRNQ